jgi:SOS-response transcriptional repressor LexA
MIEVFKENNNGAKNNKGKSQKSLPHPMKQAIERLKQFKAEKPLTNEDIVKTTGIQKSNLSEILNFRRSIPINLLIKLHERYGLSCDYILFDIKKPPVPKLTLADLVKLTGPGLNHEDFVTVPLVSGKIAATIGSGIIVDEYVEDWAVVHQKVTGKKRNLISIRIDETDGDSMKPIMGPGDVVIIDRDDRIEIVSDAIYAVRIDEASTVKKVQQKGRYLFLISQNKDYEPIIIDINDIENPVIGRVIWCSKKL